MQTIRYLVFFFILSLFFTTIFGSPIRMERKKVPTTVAPTTSPIKKLDKAKVLTAPIIHAPCSGAHETMDNRGICRKIL